MGRHSPILCRLSLFFFFFSFFQFFNLFLFPSDEKIVNDIVFLYVTIMWTLMTQRQLCVSYRWLPTYSGSPGLPGKSGQRRGFRLR